jgi:hypothetical protein
MVAIITRPEHHVVAVVAAHLLLVLLVMVRLQRQEMAETAPPQQ